MVVRGGKPPPSLSKAPDSRREFEREYSSGFASFGLVDCRGVRGLTDGGRPGSRESRRSIGVPEEM